MSERYALFEIEFLRDRFALPAGVPKGVRKQYNISPTQLAPVITNTDGSPALQLMNWGFVQSNAKDMNGVFRYKSQAVRSEKVFSKPAWEHAIQQQRCIIPANGYYQWRNLKSGKTPFFVSLPKNELISFAGIYQPWTDSDGVTHMTYALLTIDVRIDTLPVSERIPIVLHRSDEATWLDNTVADFSTLTKIMRPYEDTPLVARPIGDAINSKKIDNPSLISPLI